MMGAISRLKVTCFGAEGRSWGALASCLARAAAVAEVNPSKQAITVRDKELIRGPRYSIPLQEYWVVAPSRSGPLGWRRQVRGWWRQAGRGQRLHTSCRCGHGRGAGDARRRPPLLG